MGATAGQWDRLYDVCIVHLADARYYPLFQRQAFTLRDAGYRVALVSWERRKGEGEPGWPGVDVYPITIDTPSFSGKLFFARYTAALTVLLLRLRARLYQAVDPVALLPARLAAARHGARYNYFSLEYFQGVEQMAGRPLVRKVWLEVERAGLRRARNTAVVCRSTAERLAALYGIALPHVVRNVPLASEYAAAPDGSLRRRLGIAPDTPLAVFKGDVAGGRGLVPFVKAMPHVPALHLALLGEGPLRAELQKLCGAVQVQDRVHFAGRIEPQAFPSMLKEGDLGHAMHENTGENMPLTLPSKLFDYLHAGLPVLCGNRGEMAEIITRHQAGWCVDPGSPEAVAGALRAFVASSGDWPAIRARARAAAAEYRWEREQEAYLAYVREALER